MDQRHLCTLGSKIKCIFETEVIHGVEDASELKRTDQTYCVRAFDVLRTDFEQAFNEKRCVPTEKVDGTSTIVKKYNGEAWLWVRRDRKLTKEAEKIKKQNEGKLLFNMNNYRFAPESWVASESCIDAKTGKLVPDITGNIMGWVPLDSDKLYTWHAETVGDNKRMLVLNVLEENKDLKFELNYELLSDHEHQSFELIGTNVNGNPYKLGSKKHPIHFLIRHGCIPIYNLCNKGLTRSSITEWFTNNDCGNIEGIVWHCGDGQMFKVTRQHLKLKWPNDNDARLNKISVSVHLCNVNSTNKYINKFHRLSNRSFKTLSDLSSYYISIHN